MAAKDNSVPAWMSTEACSLAHFDQVSSWALEARALSSFSKFSCVNKGDSEASVTVAGFGDLADLGVDADRAMLAPGRRGRPSVVSW